jgi:hypothetical protein
VSGGRVDTFSPNFKDRQFFRNAISSADRAARRFFRYFLESEAFAGQPESRAKTAG